MSSICVSEPDDIENITIMIVEMLIFTIMNTIAIFGLYGSTIQLDFNFSSTHHQQSQLQVAFILFEQVCVSQSILYQLSH